MILVFDTRATVVSLSQAIKTRPRGEAMLSGFSNSKRHHLKDKKK